MNNNYEKYCSRCGMETVSNCDNCGALIKGRFAAKRNTRYVYTRPSYCHKCGHALPWTQTILENAIELVSLDDSLNDEIKGIIKNALPDLIVETPTTPIAVAKYKKFIPAAAEYVKNGLRDLLVDVASETVKKAIFD